MWTLQVLYLSFHVPCILITFKRTSPRYSRVHRYFEFGNVNASAIKTNKQTNNNKKNKQKKQYFQPFVESGFYFIFSRVCSLTICFLPLQPQTDEQRYSGIAQRTLQSDRGAEVLTLTLIWSLGSNVPSLLHPGSTGYYHEPV